MNDSSQTQEDLLRELSSLRRQIALLEKSEAQWKKSAEWFRVLFEKAPVNYQSLDEDGKIIEVNQEWLDTLGYAREEVIGRWFGDLLKPQEHPLFRENFKRYKEQGEIHDLELELLRMDGSYVTVRYEGRIGYDESGRFQRTHCIFRDVTDIKLTEEALRTSEDRYKLVVENAHEVIIVAQDGMIKYANPVLFDIIGPSEGIYSRPFVELVHPEDRQMVMERHQARIAGEEPPTRYRFRINDRNGEIRWIELHVTLFSWDNRPATLNFLNDITERKQAEDALRKSEEKYRNLIDSLPQIVFEADETGTLTLVNRAAYAMSGYTPTDLAKGMNILQMIIPEDRDRAVSNMQKIMDGDLSPGNEYIFLRKDGSTFPAIIYSNPVVYDSKICGILGFVLDISQSKHAEAVLRESESRYRAIFENTGTTMIIVEEDTTISLTNAEFEKLTGFKREDIEGKRHWPDFVVPEDREVMLDRHRQRRMDSDVPLKNYEFRIIDHEGVIRNILLCVDMIPGTHRSIASLIDITGRKQAEAALAESEARYRAMFSHMNSGVVVYEPLNGGEDFIVKDLNDAAERISRISREKVHGKRLFSILPELRESALAEAMKRVCRTGRLEYLPPTHYAADPLVDWAESSIYRLPSGDIVTIYNNVSDMMKAASALRESEERYRLLVEHANDAIFIISNGVITFPNPKCTEMIGYSADELLRIPFIDHIHPQDRQAVAARQGHQSAEVSPPGTYTFRLINGQKKELWVQSSTVHIQWAGQPATLNFFRDITEAKRLEAQLMQAQKMEAIGTLAGGIAHDFNNILGAIIGYTEMAMGYSGHETASRHLQQVMRASERAKNLVKQILSFSRQKEQQRSPVEIGVVVKEALKLLRSTLPATIEIRRNVPAEPLVVLADPTELHQVIMNLCTNAAHAMREKGGVLELRLSLCKVSSQSEIVGMDLEPGPYIQLTVSDTGHGIDAAIMDRIYDPFFTTKDTGEGTGLGLSVVYGIVRSLQGAITVQSETGKGTAFTIHLPCIAAEEAGVGRSVPDIMPEGGENILMVDDEEFLVDVVGELLKSLGYQVMTATSPLEAVKHFQDRPDRFDLIITDMTMPSMTGVELAKRVLDIRPDIPIILCTGHSDLIDEQSAKSLGICEFLTKPIFIQDLALIVRRVLDENRGSD